MAIPVKRQGDALWFTAPATGLDGVEAQWTLWTGTWAVVTFAGDVATTYLSGALSKGAVIGEFYGHIGTTQMKTLAPGKYTVVCQAVCASVDYEQEFAHEPLTIKGAGIPA